MSPTPVPPPASTLLRKLLHATASTTHVPPCGRSPGRLFARAGRTTRASADCKFGLPPPTSHAHRRHLARTSRPRALGSRTFGWHGLAECSKGGVVPNVGVGGIWSACLRRVATPQKSSGGAPTATCNGARRALVVQVRPALACRRNRKRVASEAEGHCPSCPGRKRGHTIDHPVLRRPEAREAALGVFIAPKAAATPASTWSSGRRMWLRGGLTPASRSAAPPRPGCVCPLPTGPPPGAGFCGAEHRPAPPSPP
jgi:hypothetical protein